jgi:hypothetical protein
LLGSCSTAWGMPPALFALVIFEVGSCVFSFAQGQPGSQSSYLCFPVSWGNRRALPHPDLFLLQWSLSNFSPPHTDLEPPK